MQASGVIAGIFVLLAVPGTAQEQPVFRSETAGVTVDVIVTDRKGRHINGLQASDFRLFEDGAPQPVAEFTAPPSRRATARYKRTGSAPAASEPQMPTAARPPQLITLLIDLGDLHSENLKRACDSASHFAEKTIAAGNSLAIYWVDTALHLALPFSQDKDKALGILKRLGGRLPTGRFGARERERTEMEIDDLFVRAYPETLRGAEPTPRVTEGADNGPSRGRRDAGQELELMEQQAAFRELNMLRSWLTTASALQARTVFVALRAMALGYRDIPGRKSVVVVSEGFLHSREAEGPMQAVVDAANRSNVAIYVISALGLASGPNAELMAPPTPMGRRGKGDFTKLGSTARSGGLNQFDWLQTMDTDPTGDLDVLARATGGFLVKNTNDFGRELDRIEDDAGEFYTLVYYPTNRNYNGAFRKLKVELAEKGYQVRYRQGYWALPPGREVLMTPASAQLLAGIESGERKPAFSPTVNAALVAAPSGRFSVAAAVSMPGKDVRFQRSAEEFVAGINLVLLVRDAAGELLAVHERYAGLRLNQANHAEFITKLFNMQGHLPVPALQPVTVQAIVRLSDDSVGLSSRQSLHPAPSIEALQITNLVLSDNVGPSSCGKDPLDPLCLQDRRIEIPSQSRFPASTQMVVYFSVLGLKLDGDQTPALNMTFRLGSKGGLKDWEPDQIRAVKGGTPDALLVMAVFNLQPLASGTYALEAHAEDDLRRKTITERAQFAVQ